MESRPGELHSARRPRPHAVPRTALGPGGRAFPSWRTFSGCAPRASALDGSRVPQALGGVATTQAAQCCAFVHLPRASCSVSRTTSWEDPPAGHSVLLAPGLVPLLISHVKDSSGFGSKRGAKTKQPLGPRTGGELEGRGVGGAPLSLVSPCPQSPVPCCALPVLGRKLESLGPQGHCAAYGGWGGGRAGPGLVCSWPGLLSRQISRCSKRHLLLPFDQSPSFPCAPLG